VYKLYTSILNDRIVNCTSNVDTLIEEQNGFRRNRSTIDHVSSVTHARNVNYPPFVLSLIFEKHLIQFIEMCYGKG
jgi:hypothetical protein